MSNIGRTGGRRLKGWDKEGDSRKRHSQYVIPSPAFHIGRDNLRLARSATVHQSPLFSPAHLRKTSPHIYHYIVRGRYTVRKS